MKITKRIYEQTCIALSKGYVWMIKSTTKKGFKNNQAVGDKFEDFYLYQIKSCYENGRDEIAGKRLKNITIKLDSRNIKFSDMMRLKEFNKEIPSLLYHSTNLREALKNNYWFLNLDREPKYIYANWNSYPGIFTYNDTQKMFKYQDRKNNIIIEKKNIDEIISSNILKKFKNDNEMPIKT